MKLTKRQLKQIIKEERSRILREMFPARSGERWGPIEQEIIQALVVHAEEEIMGSEAMTGATPAQLLRAAADWTEGAR